MLMISHRLSGGLHLLIHNPGSLFNMMSWSILWQATEKKFILLARTHSQLSSAEMWQQTPLIA